MSYAGSCTGGNSIQQESDPYFHVGNIVQVRNFVAMGDGNLCGETLSTNNNTPTAATDIPALGLYLPISTPFVLSGSGSDSDGDVLSYCWEQYDLGPVTQLGAPIGTAPSFAPFRLFRYLKELSPAFKRWLATTHLIRRCCLPITACLLSA